MAIRSVERQAHMIHTEPLIQVVAPCDRPDLAKAAHHEIYVDSFVAWNILYGKNHSEYGRSPETLEDVIDAANRLKLKPDADWS